MNDNKWIIKQNKMTYILGGKLNNKPFILVDKVVNSDPDNITDKLYSSVSNNDVHISLTGDGVLMDYIKIYDSECQKQGKKLIINNKFIKKITTDFTNNYSENIEPKTSLFIIDGNEFYKIDCLFHNGEFTYQENKKLKNGEYFVNYSPTPETITIKVDDIKDFGTYWLQRYYNSSINSKSLSFEEYFKDGFCFIEI